MTFDPEKWGAKKFETVLSNFFCFRSQFNKLNRVTTWHTASGCPTAPVLINTSLPNTSSFLINSTKGFPTSIQRGKSFLIKNLRTKGNGSKLNDYLRVLWICAIFYCRLQTKHSHLHFFSPATLKLLFCSSVWSKFKRAVLSEKSQLDCFPAQRSIKFPLRWQKVWCMKWVCNKVDLASFQSFSEFNFHHLAEAAGECTTFTATNKAVIFWWNPWKR